MVKKQGKGKSFWILDQRGKSKVKHVQKMSSSLLVTSNFASSNSLPRLSILSSSYKRPIFFIFFRKLVAFLCLSPNLIFFVGIGLWLKTGPSTLGFCFGTFFVAGFLGFVVFNSLRRGVRYRVQLSCNVLAKF